MTREEWLESICRRLDSDVFTPNGHKIPPVKVSVGFPSKNATSNKRRRIGECWASESSTNKVSQIFCSPTLSDSYQMADTLAHELVHAVDDCKNGHRLPFKRICKDIGLTKGKATSASAGPELEITLRKIISDIGEIPHSELIAGSIKKQTTRMIKIVCPECGYTARTTETWLGIGLPVCCCGNEMERA